MKRRRNSKDFAKLSLIWLVSLLVASSIVPPQVLAQSLQLGPNYVPNYAQQVMPGNPGPLQPPPVGDGNNPPQEIPGDVAAPPPVPSGTADPGPSAKMPNFPTGAGHDRSVVRIYHTNNRGEREVQTLRGDTLSQDEISQIEGILGINMESGEQTIVATATDAQLEQINDVLSPYPQYAMNNGKKKINNDAPGRGYPKPNRNSLYGFDNTHPLPTVWTFCRYLVILGVVCACIFMALASYAMVMGHPYGGSRAFGAAAGLMMLLCGYTIWKIVQMNTFGANSDNPGNTPNVQRPTQAQVQDAFMARPNTPVNPGAGRANPQRGGIPVVPLGNAINP